MNVLAVLHLVELFHSIGLGCFVLTYDPRGRRNQIFFAYCLLISWQALGDFQIITAPSASRAIFWMKALVFRPFIASLLLHLIVEFTGLARGAWRWLLLALGYAAAPIFA